MSDNSHANTGAHNAGGAHANEHILLTARGLSKRYGGVQAVGGVDIDVERGRIVSIIGPNGAGKTTVFNLLSGVDKMDAGNVELDGHDLTGLKQHHISKMGVGRTFQNIRLFKGLSVLENVMTAMDARGHYTFWESLVHFGRFGREERSNVEHAREYLDVVGLLNLATARPEALSYGHQRRLEIARALACQPKVLLLDEPAAGLNPGEIDRFVDLLRSLMERYDLTVLLIEHRMRLVMRLSHHVYVMNFGKIIAEGEPKAVVADPAVSKAYIGEKTRAHD